MLLPLLRAAIWQQSCQLTESVDWPVICRMAEKQGVGPLIYDQALKQTGKAALPSQLYLQLQQICMQNMLSQSLWESRIAKTWKSLQQGGVEPVLLKGFGLAQLYPLPYLRSWGDADVWVGIDQYHKSCGVLREVFPECKHHDVEWDELKHYCFVFPDDAAIELHRVAMDFISPQDAAYWQELETRGMQGGPHIMVGKQDVALPRNDFNQLFVFLHAWEHFGSSGLSLKLLADMTLLAHKLYVDESAEERAVRTAYLKKHLEALCLTEVWQMIGWVAVEALQLPEEEWPLYVNDDHTSRRGQKLLQRVLAEGQCRDGYVLGEQRYEARERARQMNLVHRKWMTLMGRWRHFRFMHAFAPRYARHEFWGQIRKGIRRTIHGSEMINY